MTTTAKQIIETLNLTPHPEGGYFVETFRDPATSPGSGRSHSTLIYYLLEGGDRSHWHKVDAVEIWHYYAGAPLKLSLWKEGEIQDIEEGGKPKVREVLLGGDVLKGERPQGVVEKDEWQSAVSTGDWTLVGCTVAPGFVNEGFFMAPPGWEPGEVL